ncbi:MAG: sensor domain-containing diguanylate cyclase [Leptolyngbyaceae cyanobacterium RM1_1_2]|nr:sensor domain-containing diguanylate cyclase [Leptolyngbyaceae cyanobacterium RM1_1_2]
MKIPEPIALQAVLDQHHHHLQLLQQMMVIVQQTSGEQVYQAIAQQIGTALAASRCLIWSNQAQKLKLQAVYQVENCQLPCDVCPKQIQACIEDRLSHSANAFVISVEGEITDFQPGQNYEDKAFFCWVVPTYSRQQLNGWLGLQMAQADWEALPSQWIQDITVQLGIAIAQNRLADCEHRLKLSIIERTQAEKAWQESQRFIQNITDASTNILYLYELEGKYLTYANQQLEKVLGYRLSEIQSHPTQIVHLQDLERLNSQRQQSYALQDGEVIEGEYRFRHSRGYWRWLLIRETVYSRLPDGTPCQLMGTATDITALKQTSSDLEKANETLKRIAATDELTQLANRRYLIHYLALQWQKLLESQQPLTLILCDVDYFKRYNDTYGHQCGDECLRQVGLALSTSVRRSSDLVARYGGEEFVLVLPQTSLEAAGQVAKRVRHNIRQQAIEHRQSEVSPYLTVSLGIASAIPDDLQTTEKLIARADQALYAAKCQGRDRICIANPDGNGYSSIFP